MQNHKRCHEVERSLAFLIVEPGLFRTVRRCDAAVLFIWALRRVIMGLPSLHVCVHMCIVCVAQSMRRQLHCCAPLSLTFLEAQVWSQHLQLLLPATRRRRRRPIIK